jgi:hypothetical protein
MKIEYFIATAWRSPSASAQLVQAKNLIATLASIFMREV